MTFEGLSEIDASPVFSSTRAHHSVDILQRNSIRMLVFTSSERNAADSWHHTGVSRVRRHWDLKPFHTADATIERRRCESSPRTSLPSFQLYSVANGAQVGRRCHYTQNVLGARY